MRSVSKTAFYEEDVSGLGVAKDSDDLLHYDLWKSEPGAELTETHYLGFNSPEHGIHGVGYLWYHPNLKMASGGVLVWQGFKRRSLEAEMWDVRMFMDDGFLKDDLWKYTMESGYAVETIAPLKAHRIRYACEETRCSFEIQHEALMPPIMHGSGLHFEQPMRTRGEVRINGTRYDVNATTMRDRSFGALRRERPEQKLPPLAWMNCAFSEKLAFGCTAFDDPAKDTQLAQLFPLPGGKALRGGWLCKDGVPSALVSASKVVCGRMPGSYYPTRVELTLVDQLGRTAEIVGHPIAGNHWATWYNIDADVTLMRWECDGQVGHGDYQEFLWPGYVRHFHP